MTATAPAPAVRAFRLPDLGEGLADAEVLRWLVAPGERVALSQPLVEVETAKAAVEIPSPWAGVVVELHAAEGDTVEVGEPLITVDTSDGSGPASGDAPPSSPAASVPAPDGSAGAGSAGSAAEPAPEPADAPSPSGDGPPPAEGERRQAVLVGYGVRARSARRRPRRDRPLRAPRTERPATDADAAGGVGEGRPRATPPVRRLAKDSGVDLASLRGSGPDGRITRDDVAAAAAGTRPSGRTGQEPDEVRTKVAGVRRATATAMVRSAFTAPHVTEWLDVDITATTELRRALDGGDEVGGQRVPVLALVARAFLLALRRSPEANASYDDATDEIVVHRRVGLGLAAATDRGLLVPVVHDAHRLAFRDLLTALEERTRSARDGTLRPEDLRGGTATITNVGSLGVDAGTPILPPGQSVILALGAVRRRPWVVDEAVVPRDVVTLALSFDHRVVDGDLGSRVLVDTAAVLRDPRLALVRC